jgi:hypothetical protein
MTRALKTTTLTAIATIAVLCTVATPAQAGESVHPKLGSYVGIGSHWFGLGLQVKRQKLFGSESKAVGNILWHGRFDGCPASDGSDGFTELDGTGKVSRSVSSAESTSTVVLHFVSPTKARGSLTYEDKTGSCGGSATRKFVVQRAVRGQDGHSTKALDGRYAGAGKDTYVWFDVTNGWVNYAGYVQSFFGGCGQKTDLLLGGDYVSKTGRFSVYDSDGADAIVLGGQFTSPRSVTGKVLWNTPDNCPAGTSKFPYTARRLGR